MPAERKETGTGERMGEKIGGEREMGQGHCSRHIHYNKTRNMDLEAIEGDAKVNGYTCNSAHRIIDGHDGLIVNCYGSERYNESYRFTYQLDNKTVVSGTLSLDWDTTVLPFLNSLHVKEVE
jgi:hypothetical protein